MFDFTEQAGKTQIPIPIISIPLSACHLINCFGDVPNLLVNQMSIRIIIWNISTTTIANNNTYITITFHVTCLYGVISQSPPHVCSI